MQSKVHSLFMELQARYPAQWLSEVFFSADEWHRGQKRKYSGDPYILHPLRVAMRVVPFADPDLVKAALFHDVIEDCGATLEDVVPQIGLAAALIVQEVTNVYEKDAFPTWNRAHRQEWEAHRLSFASLKARILKGADRLDNLRDMNGAEAGFLHKYKQESVHLFHALNAQSMLPVEIHMPLRDELSHYLGPYHSS